MKPRALVGPRKTFLADHRWHSHNLGTFHSHNQSGNYFFRTKTAFWVNPLPSPPLSADVICEFPLRQRNHRAGRENRMFLLLIKEHDWLTEQLAALICSCKASRLSNCQLKDNQTHWEHLSKIRTRLREFYWMTQATYYLPSSTHAIAIKSDPSAYIADHPKCFWPGGWWFQKVAHMYYYIPNSN